MVGPRWSTRRVRDLLILSTAEDEVVIACDSVGGIGAKPADTSYNDPAVVTHLAARVPLLEVLAAGAEPRVVVDTLSVEKDPAALPMIAELRRLVGTLGLDPDISLTGSTEDNVETRATGIGVTVIGTAPAGALRLGTARPGDVVLCVGLPLSAPQHRLSIDDPRMPSLAEVGEIIRIEGVHEVLPVGSRGVSFEVGELAATCGTRAAPRAASVDPIATAGPSSCVLVAATAEGAARVQELRADLPIAHVADLEQKEEEEE